MQGFSLAMMLCGAGGIISTLIGASILRAPYSAGSCVLFLTAFIASGFLLFTAHALSTAADEREKGETWKDIAHEHTQQVVGALAQTQARLTSAKDKLRHICRVSSHPK